MGANRVCGRSDRRRGSNRVFVTPTLVHFSAAFFISLLALVPDGHRVGTAVWTLVCGIAGLGYVVTIGRKALSSKFIEPWDHWARAFYVPLPAIAYLLTVAGSVAALWRWSDVSMPLATASAILLAVGIGNAWAMALFTVEYAAPKVEKGRSDGLKRNSQDCFRTPPSSGEYAGDGVGAKAQERPQSSTPSRPRHNSESPLTIGARKSRALFMRKGSGAPPPMRFGRNRKGSGARLPK
jgi:hypothetical protein